MIPISLGDTANQAYTSTTNPVLSAIQEYAGAVDPGVIEAVRSQASLQSGVDPKYQLRLDVDNTSMKDMGFEVFPIIVPLPERFTMAIDSQWSLPFSETSVGDMLGGKTFGEKAATTTSAGRAGVVMKSAGALNNVMNAAGMGTKNLYQFMQVWDSTSPISFSFDFIFNAKTNAVEDIKKKHLALLKLAAPSDIGGTGMLSSPGPSIPTGFMNEISKGNSQAGRQLTLTIGEYLVIENVIVKSVSSDIQCLMGEEGIPMWLTVSVTFETFVSGCTTQMLDQWFKVSGPVGSPSVSNPSIKPMY